MLSLVADYDTTSSSNSDEEEDTKEKQPNRSSSTSAKPSPLPSANFLLNGGSSTFSGDVFNNPFLEAEKSEIDKLQKHVKMVESENHLLQKNGRKICWNNRKGRCRFGNKCKYAHDSDLVDAREVPKEKQFASKEIKTTATKSMYSFEAHSVESDERNESNENFKIRKRPGLGDSIVPGKRVMKGYLNTKKPSL